MAAYVTQADMLVRFREAELIERTNLGDPQAATVDGSVLDVALEDASNEIDSYLARFSLPLASVPAILKRLCCDIARYRLYFDATNESESRPEWRTRYEDAIAVLTKISNGELDLQLPTGSAESPLLAEVRAAPRVFSRDRLREW